MKKLNQKDKVKIVKRYRAVVAGLEHEQQRLFKKACSELQLDPESGLSDILYDTIFNGFSTPTKAVRKIWPAQVVVKSSETKVEQL